MGGNCLLSVKPGRLPQRTREQLGSAIDSWQRYCASAALDAVVLKHMLEAIWHAAKLLPGWPLLCDNNGIMAKHNVLNHAGSGNAHLRLLMSIVKMAID